MKPRIAIVRGHFYSREESLSFKALEDEFDVTLFISPGSNQDTEIGLPVVTLPCLDSKLNAWTSGYFSRIYGLINIVTGIEPEVVFGLRDKLSGFDIVYTNDYNYFLTLR